jgi:hypothetical protein
MLTIINLPHQILQYIITHQLFEPEVVQQHPFAILTCYRLVIASPSCFVIASPSPEGRSNRTPLSPYSSVAESASDLKPFEEHKCNRI